MCSILRQVFRLRWHNTDTNTEVEQVAVPAGEKTAAPSDVALGHSIHVTVVPEPAEETPSEASGVPDVAPAPPAEALDADLQPGILLPPEPVEES
jgi:hypothetical protein